MNAESRKVILLVDDTPANIQIALSILKEDYQVRVATNGTRALELAASEPLPDLVLLDVIMPGLDGFEVCTRLKASPVTNDIPVIFLTGQTEIEDETRGFDVGGVDYIHKPFSPAVVKARVQTHLVLRGIREQLARQLSTIKAELETARQIQLSILPRKMPVIDGLDVAARYLPMTEVAGDFYDFIVVDEKRLGILVADVSGHGMPSALISSMLKIALAAQRPVAADPAAVLLGLNQALYGKFQGHFVTAAYVFIDTENKVLQYAGAGHPPLMVRSQAAGCTSEFEENGLILGAFPGAAYTSIEVPLGSGDWAVLYTDGILETTNAARVEFGTGGLKVFMERSKDLAADEFVDGLMAEVANYGDQANGRGREDDLTLIAVHCTGSI
ncbi:Serine phosphatase RsbU, regulator of sigma subunit [Acidisarcina polymorpha]|uniref:Serine phosphatase RsbU, regulator of sigma subunit n=1 Tax=Acidisarcina polymorpha TaxID=2211140 RepID=A0A2Z5G7M4_9BACT|nr:SpoIIE family protein phosphatase [Acidisarcina polymorpha]AXC14566.1 Serine phosphatase RsbU, regulator of sigma subunit [Acidisarcina polymorpha]